MEWLINKSPYEVQAKALERTAHAPHGFAYFMEMGLGKTAVVIAEFMQLVVACKVRKLVVVAPFSLLQNWKREVALWTDGIKGVNGNLRVSVWPDTKDADVYILNYEAFAVGGATGTAFVRGLCDNNDTIMVLDESTQIKNNSSVRTKALLSLARSAAFTRVLSGAPMTQGPHDLWSQLKFINELRGVNYYQFRNRYCRLGGFKGKQIMGPNPERISELHDILSRCAFRAKKTNWLDLPEKTFFEREIKLSSSYISAYKKMTREMYMEIGGGEVSAPMAISLMLKLQCISSGFVITDEGETVRLPGANAKLNELLSIIDTELDTKVIIPLYFQESQLILQEALTKQKIPFARILSKMSPGEIEDEKKKFNKDDSCKVALAQTSSQKYGHTLLGTNQTPCHTTIFYENTFSLDDRLQMEDRNHRIGQRFPVNIIDLVCSPIERKAILALQRKENVAKVIVDAIKTERI